MGTRRLVARDQNPGDEAGGIGQVKVFLKNRLSEQDFARLEQMLQQLAGGGEEDEPNHRRDPMPDDPDDEVREDEPKPFAGRPRPGGEQDREARDRRAPRGRFAQDARRDGSDYFSMFPGNRLVGTSDYGR